MSRKQRNKANISRVDPADIGRRLRLCPNRHLLLNIVDAFKVRYHIAGSFERTDIGVAYTGVAEVFGRTNLILYSASSNTTRTVPLSACLAFKPLVDFRLESGDVWKAGESLAKYLEPREEGVEERIKNLTSSFRRDFDAAMSSPDYSKMFGTPGLEYTAMTPLHFDFLDGDDGLVSKDDAPGVNNGDMHPPPPRPVAQAPLVPQQQPQQMAPGAPPGHEPVQHLPPQPQQQPQQMAPGPMPVHQPVPQAPGVVGGGNNHYNQHLPPQQLLQMAPGPLPVPAPVMLAQPPGIDGGGNNHYMQQQPQQQPLQMATGPQPVPDPVPAPVMPAQDQQPQQVAQQVHDDVAPVAMDEEDRDNNDSDEVRALKATNQSLRLEIKTLKEKAEVAQRIANARAELISKAEEVVAGSVALALANLSKTLVHEIFLSLEPIVKAT